METKIGKNIKRLRLAFGLTQKELADKINVAENYISMFEKGTRVPTAEIQNALANCFHITIEELNNGTGECDIKAKDLHFTLENNNALIDAMFPVVSSEEAEHNAEFKIAYNAHINILKKIKKGENITQDKINDCIEKYSETCGETELLEASANLVGILLLVCSLISDENTEKFGKQVFDYGHASSSALKTFYLRKGTEKPEYIEQRRTFADDSFEEVVELLKQLKRSPKWADLADFYMALRHIVGFVGNEYGEEINNLIGSNMMEMFTITGNEYALNFYVARQKFLG